MKRQTRTTRKRSLLGLVLAPPDQDDIITLLLAWRFWLLAAFVGSVIGLGVYIAAPPPFRARATVNVDFHLEQAWPQQTDREQFYYLEREARKLEEIAFSDATLADIASQAPFVTVPDLRSGVLRLGQPGNGGWHFYADYDNPERAALLANAWAQSFTRAVREQVVARAEGGLEPFITADLTQSAADHPLRNQTVALYMLVGAGVVLVLGVLGLLFVRLPR